MDGTALAQRPHTTPDEGARDDRGDGARPAPGWVPQRVARRLATGTRDAGMATAEYAIATLAAVGFAGLLVVILKSNEVRGLLSGIVKQALSL
ncbi:DUF4244 domain-containing protein [Cellulomonas sp. CW35]|uniref:DUF4244 domain-containing protein n=1 Tax=Cellulomonas sp. CW35 TaxID=3458249 RepID=UPI000A788AC3